MKLILLLISILNIQYSQRVLDIYASDKSGLMFVKQKALLAADPNGLKERNIVIKEHLGHRGFKITLTGKDGREKYSSTKLLELSKLYGIIDAMPMRREEMTKGKEGH